MTIYTDSRGYQYLGDQFFGNDLLDTFPDGNNDADSGDGPTFFNSELAQIMETQFGTGKWGLAKVGSGSWGATDSSGVWWSPASVTTGTAIDKSQYTGAFNAITGGTGAPRRDSYVFGQNIFHNTNAFSNSFATIINDPDSFFVSNDGGGSGQVDSIERIWVSCSPNHLGIVMDSLPSDPDRLVFYYQGLLQGNPNFGDPFTRFLYWAGRSNLTGESTNFRSFRPIADNDNTRQNIIVDSSYSPISTFVQLPNVTGDDYAMRWYPRDDGGAFDTRSLGYAPDLYLRDDDATTPKGTIIQGGDLDGTGNYSGSDFDGSDFNFFIKVTDLANSQSLYMRVGTNVLI